MNYACKMINNYLLTIVFNNNTILKRSYYIINTTQSKSGYIEAALKFKTEKNIAFIRFCVKTNQNCFGVVWNVFK